MSEKYNQLQAEDRYEIDCAPNLGKQYVIYSCLHNLDWLCLGFLE